MLSWYGQNPEVCPATWLRLGMPPLPTHLIYGWRSYHVKKFLPYMGAAIATLAMTWTVQAKAQDMFKDVPSDHWAYAAVSDLQQKKILVGYPNGYFQGKRVLTRYEFAVALKRALDAISTKEGPPGKDGTPGAAGPTGEAGPAGPAGPPGMTPDEVAALMKLADTFKAELAQLGTDVKAINARLDALAKTVGAMQDELNRMVKFNGDFFTGFRSDLSRTAFVDYGGQLRAASKSPFSGVDAPIDFHLIAHANLPGGVKFVGDIVESNYLNYAPLGIGGAGFSAAHQGGPLQTNLYQAELFIPVSQIGKDSTLELGRYKNQITPLTYMRPDTDPYFNLPWYSDGNYIEDGFKLSTKFGSATTQIFGGTYKDLAGTGGVPINTVNVGSFSSIPSLVGTVAEQSVGAHVGVPLMKAGEIGFTLLDFSMAPVSGSTLTNEVVYGVNVTLNPIGRIKISGEAAKSVTQDSISNGDHNSNDDDNAFNLHLAYKSKGLGILAGYQYIDPRFSAPGYWDKIGSVYNPVNVQGPYVKLGYGFTPKLDATFGGEYLEGARNRADLFGAVGTGGVLVSTMGSSVGKMEAGLKYHLNKTVHLSLDYEGDFFNVSGALTGSGDRAYAYQQYLTLGAGVNLTGNTVLKFGYQILADQTRLDATTLGEANANTFTTSVTVHF
jgi:hypothetical protein